MMLSECSARHDGSCAQADSSSSGSSIEPIRAGHGHSLFVVVKASRDQGHTHEPEQSKSSDEA